MIEDNFDVYVDAKGLSCPMPLLKAKQALNKMEIGQLLKLEATDAGSVRDISAFIKLTDHELLSSTEDGSVYRYLIRRG